MGGHSYISVENHKLSPWERVRNGEVGMKSKETRADREREKERKDEQERAKARERQPHRINLLSPPSSLCQLWRRLSLCTIFPFPIQKIIASTEKDVTEFLAWERSHFWHVDDAFLPRFYRVDISEIAWVKHFAFEPIESTVVHSFTRSHCWQSVRMNKWIEKKKNEL